MRIRRAAVAVALALSAGCTAAPTGQASSAQVQSESETTSSSTTSTTPTTSTRTPPSTSTSPQITSSTSPSTSASATTSSYPGGKAGAVDLVRNGWLDAEGRLILRRDIAQQATTDGPTLCSFVFGTVPEIASLTQLPADATLDDISGVQISDEALLLACVYDVGGAPALVLQIGVGPDIDPDLPGGPVIIRDGAVQGVFSYAPGRSGLSADTARQWLTEAAARVAFDEAESAVDSTE